MTPIRGPLARLERSRDELAKAWLVRLIERASLDEISELPTERIARELPELITDIVGSVAETNGDPYDLSEAQIDRAASLAALRAGREVRLFGSGARRRDITDVADVAEGMVRMLERRIEQMVNLGTGTSHRLDDVVATVARQCGLEPVVAVEPAAADDVVTTRADVERCRELLGFVPVTDLATLVARQIAATPVPRRAVVGAP
jgi:hypothetical protein